MWAAVLVATVASLVVVGSPASAYPPEVKTEIFPLASDLDPVRATSIAFGADGELWFAGTGDARKSDASGDYFGGTIGLVGHVSAEGRVVEIPLGRSPGSLPGSIVLGPDGAMWFTLAPADAIGRVAPDGTVTRFSVPGGRSPGKMVAGPDGDLWFTEPGVGAIGRMTTTGELTEFKVGAKGSPSGIAVGPDGNLWFTLKDSDRIGRLTLTGERAVFQLPKGSEPGAIVATARGLWFSERPRPFQKRHPIVRLGLISTDGRFRQVTLPARTPVVALAAGADGTVWYATKRFTPAIGSISPTLEPSHLACPGSSECVLPPVALTVAPDGKLWFSTGTGECRICGGGTGIAEGYEPGLVGYLMSE